MDNTINRKICVVTGTRAEYGHLYWLMKEIKDDPDLELQLVATGMHLSPEFGLTYRTIEEDGFTIDEKVEMLFSNFLLGNSSRGLYEPPTLKVPVVNAGLWQAGRLKVANIISSAMLVIPLKK